MSGLAKTILHDRHVAAGAKMVDFGGFDMPLQYSGIVAEHLATRKNAGLFDVSHMGRFVFRGRDAVSLLRRSLTNDAAKLAVGQSQYTIIADPEGGAIDDAYLYRFVEHEYLLVVNASNRRKDWEHLSTLAGDYADVSLKDESESIAMIALQGPRTEAMLCQLIDDCDLPAAKRNAAGIVSLCGVEVPLARTGYTGEVTAFELLPPAPAAKAIWEEIICCGAIPNGLGARDTLRLEAALPLYGHEFGTDPQGQTIPIFACPLASFGVDLADPNRDFIGRGVLARQAEAKKAHEPNRALRRVIRPFALTGPGVARPGCKVLSGGREIGVVTSGTACPYWIFDDGHPSVKHAMRSIGMALIDIDADCSDLMIDVRGRGISARLAQRFLAPQPPYARPVL